MDRRKEFAAQGFTVFPAEEAVKNWARYALEAARIAVADPVNRHGLRCGGTWFVGVDALPNDETGAVPGGPPLSGAAMEFIKNDLRFALPLHRAQVSVCYPGYPQPSPDETPAAFGFRLNRDAAHVDGLLAEGPARRRFLKEPHAYILGLPLTEASPDAAPLVVWQGSHRHMGKVFTEALANRPQAEWPDIDLTEAYQAARREVFASCPRVALPMKPGEACLLHRHLLHGVAPWGLHATASSDGRMIAYLRPEFPQIGDWLASG